MKVVDAEFAAWRDSGTDCQLCVGELVNQKVAYKSASGVYRSRRAGALRGPRVGRRAWRPLVDELGMDGQSMRTLSVILVFVVDPVTE